jgi:hypothetical protein
VSVPARRAKAIELSFTKPSDSPPPSRSIFIHHLFFITRWSTLSRSSSRAWTSLSR